jgi:hypothetical protein
MFFMEDKKTNILKKCIRACKKNYWMPLSIILIIILITFLFVSGIPLTKGMAGNKMVDFLNSKVGGGVSLIDVESQGSFYIVNVEYQGQVVPTYMTKDGKYFISALEEIKVGSSITGNSVDTTVPNSEEIEEFVSCLDAAGFKIYGANWCGWTKKLVTSFGGFDVVEPIYVECTENSELCQSEEVTGYPTIKINGEPYSGARSFAEFATATGCSAPAGQVQSSNEEEASC